MLAETQSPKKLTENGMKAFRKQDFVAAIELFKQAEASYQANNDISAAAEVANNLSVCYLKSGHAQQAYDVVAGTDEVFAKANDIKRQAISLANQAAALEGLKRYDQALEKYEESSRLFKEIDTNLEERVMVLQSLSELHMKMGHQLDAMATMQIALSHKKKPSFTERFLKKLLRIPFGS